MDMNGLKTCGKYLNMVKIKKGTKYVNVFKIVVP